MPIHFARLFVLCAQWFCQAPAILLPEEIDDYITILFEEYAKDGDTGALLSSLRVLGRVKGLTKLAEEAGLSRKGVQKALSEEGNPAFASINSIMHAMGYRLAPKKLEARTNS